jgi:hypothetical protein
MHRSWVALIVIAFANLFYGSRASKSSLKLPHPRYSTVGNPHISSEDNCALRAFGIEMAAYIAPAASKANWTALSQSVFQMNQCNGTSHTAYQPSSSAKPFTAAPEMQKEACQHTVFVHDLEGNDLFDGTFERSMKTIQGALSLTRSLRTLHGDDKISL